VQLETKAIKVIQVPQVLMEQTETTVQLEPKEFRVKKVILEPQVPMDQTEMMEPLEQQALQVTKEYRVFRESKVKLEALVQLVTKEYKV